MSLECNQLVQRVTLGTMHSRGLLVSLLGPVKYAECESLKLKANFLSSIPMWVPKASPMSFPFGTL